MTDQAGAHAGSVFVVRVRAACGNLPIFAQSLPPMSLAGLDGTAEVYRDGYGIPHVRAQSTNDAFFAQGFVTAQDRLWHMDYDRHRAYGRWAELAGPVGLEQDLVMRRFRLNASARSDYQVLGQEAKAMLDSYTSGVNAFINSSKHLPVEYLIVGTEPEPWQPWDCLSVFKVRHILMGVFLTIESEFKTLMGM